MIMMYMMNLLKNELKRIKDEELADKTFIPANHYVYQF